MLCIFGVIYSNSSKHMFYLHYFVLNVSQRQLFSWIPNRPLPSSGAGQLAEALRCPPPETRSTGCCESIEKWLYFSS